MSSISPPRRTLSNNTIIRTYRQPLVDASAVQTTMFERLQAGERAAATECLTKYGNFVWAIAKKNTRSVQEAELVAECVFEEIWNGAGSKLNDLSERRAIEQITVRCIFRHKLESRNIF